jgi:hypothetical protein
MHEGKHGLLDGVEDIDDLFGDDEDEGSDEHDHDDGRDHDSGAKS